MVPSAIEPLAGMMASDTKAGGPTVSVAEAVTVPAAPVIVAFPCPVAVANPLAETVAVPTAEELQLTVEVTSLELPSEKVPVALNCCELPFGTVALFGVTDNETTTGGATTKFAEPVKLL